MATVEEKVENFINDNAVAVFSKSYCPFCTRSKELLSAKGATFGVLELDQIDDGSAIQEFLKRSDKYGRQFTVPNIFIAGRHIGGDSDLQALSGDDLLRRLRDVKAL